MSVVSYRCVTSSDLKQKRLVFSLSVSTVLQVVVAFHDSSTTLSNFLKQTDTSTKWTSR